MRVTIDPITVQNWTRESFVAVDDNTNSQYRFGFQVVYFSEVGRRASFKMQSISSEFF
jgi:6-phosphofructokinase 2